jgi:hypothetical protein
MAWHGRWSLLGLAGNKGRETNCRVANETSGPILVATSAQPLFGRVRSAAPDGMALVLVCRVHRYKRRASNHIVSQERNGPSSDVLEFTGQPPTPLNRPIQIMPYSYRGPRPKSPVSLGCEGSLQAIFLTKLKNRVAGCPRFFTVLQMGCERPYL